MNQNSELIKDSSPHLSRSTETSETQKSDDEKSREEILYEKWIDKITFEGEDVLATLRELDFEPASGLELERLVQAYRQRRAEELSDDPNQAGCWT